MEILNNLELLAKRIGTDHPYEQWLKWIGIIHIQRRNFTKAENCFEAAKAVCVSHEFTMQTIGNSIELLRVVTNRINESGKTSKTHEQHYLKELDKLRTQSLSFDAYIRKSNVLDMLGSRTENWRNDSKTIWFLYTLLPFSYA